MFSKQPSNSEEIIWVGLTLTAIAGFVDAIGYLTLREIYTSNMSGNTVAVAIHLSKRNWGEALAHGCPLLAFFPGLVAGDCIVEAAKRAKLAAALMPALLVEATGLALFVLLHSPRVQQVELFHSSGAAGYEIIVALLAFTMGLQNGALRCIGALKDVHTYVTGTLLAAAHGSTSYLFWLAHRLRRTSGSRLKRILRSTPKLAFVRQALLGAALWWTYILAAIVGAFAQVSIGARVLLIPVGILILIAIVDMIRPLRRQPAATKNSSRQR
jgi:uncharacterized membrane protein YoaK (UPF0700 family)